MHIDSYQFGRIVIDGHSYDSDIKIISGKVIPHWKRDKGHKLRNSDIKDIIDAGPTQLVIGTGASGLMKVSDKILKKLQKHNITVHVLNTSGAVGRFNELVNDAENTAGAFHLTC